VFALAVVASRRRILGLTRASLNSEAQTPN